MAELDCVVGLGSNLGDRETWLRRALGLLRRFGAVTRCSRLYANPAIGPAQPDFLNGGVRLTTDQSPESLLAELQQIEQQLGRVRTERWGPRTIDLDLLWAGDVVVNTANLVVPHPALTQRAFAILPLLDVAPEAVDPVTKVAYRDVLRGLDQSVLRVVGSLEVSGS